jgi:hypothetical protein
MDLFLPPSCVTLLAVLVALPVVSAVHAQTIAAAVQAPAIVAAPARVLHPEQTIERIRTEDGATRIDEIRVGGETRGITVQPKTAANAPAYQVKPPDSAKGNAPSTSNSDTNGARVWNVLKF